LNIKTYLAKAQLLFLVFLPSCGYNLGHNQISEQYHTVSVPFAEGDATGAFTSDLIHVLSASGAYVYQPCNPDAILCVRLIEYYDENIGFRYDRDKDGEIAETIVPSETRRFVQAEVKLIDARRGCVVLGPSLIKVQVDFDHEFNSSRDAVNVFSLGQVTEIDGAIDAVARPLNRVLAQRIVDYIANAW